jgi:hypothetical protein
MYPEGIYVFVHDHQQNETMELSIFVENEKITSQIEEKKKHKVERKLSLQVEEANVRYNMMKQDDLNKDERMLRVINQLQLYCALCQGNNLNIISSYSNLAISLIPYCYKESFPVIKNY